MSNDERFKFYAATYLVLVKNGQILLSKRTNIDYQDGNYSLVSGHFEYSETAKQCVTRESKEKIDIDIRPDDLTVSHIMHRFTPDRTYIDVYLTCIAWKKTPKNMETKVCNRIKWFPLNDLPENMVPEVKLALKNIQKRIFYGEFGW